jgi:hypothetical protein
MLPMLLDLISVMLSDPHKRNVVSVLLILPLYEKIGRKDVVRGFEVTLKCPHFGLHFVDATAEAMLQLLAVLLLQLGDHLNLLAGHDADRY